MNERSKVSPAPPPLPREALVRPPPIPLVSRKAAGSVAAAAAQRGSLIGASARESLTLVESAQKLRDEQVRARVVYYEPQASTNAELDAITDDVLAELDALRKVHHSSNPPKGVDEDEPYEPSRTTRMGDEITLTAQLRRSLELLLDTRQGFLRARLEQMSRRVTTLFFETVLHTDRWDHDELRAIPSAEQAIWLAHMHTRAAFGDALRALHVERREVLDLAAERFARFERELQTELLRRRAPELERLLTALMDVFTEFFSATFRLDLGDFAWSVVRESKVARTDGAMVDGHKVSAAAFGRFRAVFEKHFLERLALGVKEPLIARLDALSVPPADDALDFVAEPRLLALVCELMCDAFYDHLQAEGVLDLPVAWRVTKRS